MKELMTVSLRKCSCALVSFVILAVSALGGGLTVFADEPPMPENLTPRLKLSSASTIEVSEGKTQEVIIEIKNVGTGRAENLFVQAVPEASQPFIIGVEILGGSFSLQAGVTKQVKLAIATESGAEEGVYPVKLTYNYTDTARNTLTENDTLNIKVNNPLSKANIRLYSFAMKPEVLAAGETGTLTFRYMNMGATVENNVQIALGGLESSKITVAKGLASQIVTKLQPGTENEMSFELKAAGGLQNGSYPIKIVTTVKSLNGDEKVTELEFFVRVGGSADAGNASLKVQNTVSPSGTYGVAQSFSVSFEVFNDSEFTANNVTVRANEVLDGAVVPTSQSMFMTREIESKKSQKYTFSFAATSSAKSQNYPVSFTIEYDKNTSQTDGEAAEKISFNQFFGVNISNPEKDDEDKDDESLKNVPKIIVSSYNSDPGIVEAGEEFDLLMTFMNSHAEKQVRNIKVSLTVTDKDDNVGASIFSPVNASNTLFIDQIAPKGTVSRSIRYYAVPDAKPQNYSIDVNFEYEDANGNEIRAQEIIGINVSQPPMIETSEINMMEMTDVGVPVSLNFEVFNTGRVAVNNLKVTLEGDMQTDGSKTTWIGNFDMGASEYVDIMFYYYEPGQKDGRIVVSYDSATGEHFEIPTEFSMTVNEMMMPEQDFPMEMRPEQGGEGGFNAKSPAVIGGGIAVVAAVIGVVGGIIYKKRKKRDAEDFFE